MCPYTDYTPRNMGVMVQNKVARFLWPIVYVASGTSHRTNLNFLAEGITNCRHKLILLGGSTKVNSPLSDVHRSTWARLKRLQTHNNTFQLPSSIRLHTFTGYFNVHMRLKDGVEWFLPARRYASAGLCDSEVSVRPSVCPSVTRRYCA